MTTDDDLTALAVAVGVLDDPHATRQAILGGTLIAGVAALAWASVSATTYLIGLIP